MNNTHFTTLALCFAAVPIFTHAGTNTLTSDCLVKRFQSNTAVQMDLDCMGELQPVYPVPNVSLEYAKNAFVHDEVMVNLIVGKNIELLGTREMEILWSEDRNTWSHGPLTYPLSSSTADTKMLFVRVRFLDSPTYEIDPTATIELAAQISFRRIKPPKIVFEGPHKAEVGGTYTWSASVQPPYPDMNHETLGQFVLPDGTSLIGTELTYTVEENMTKDEGGKLILNYTGWVEGFKDQGAVKSLNFATRIWKYSFPDYLLIKRSDNYFAPTTVTLQAVPVGSTKPHSENTQFDWNLPENVLVTRDEKPNIREIEVSDAGSYTFEVEVSDDRGNIQKRDVSFKLEKSPPYKLAAKLSPSNKFNRAPLTVTARAVVTGGHPKDSIKDLVFKIDGAVINDTGHSARTILDEGTHVLAIELYSKLGMTAVKKYPIHVVANQPPQCEVLTKDYSSSWSYTANCFDPDGKVKRYQWMIDQRFLQRSSVRMAIPKSQYSTEPSVSLQAIDDAGAESLPATN